MATIKFSLLCISIGHKDIFRNRSPDAMQYKKPTMGKKCLAYNLTLNKCLCRSMEYDVTVVARNPLGESSDTMKLFIMSSICHKPQLEILGNKKQGQTRTWRKAS